MWFVDDWHDVIRVVDAVMALLCLFLLSKRFGQNGNEWNTKTKDYWFAIVLWCLTSVVLAIEGVYEDRPLEPRLVFYVMATAVTLKGLLSKSSWGGRV